VLTIADHAGAPVLHVPHLLQQRAHVVRITLFITEACGVSGGLHARFAAEGLHAQPGVVGHRGQPGGAAGVARFHECVFHEGVKWFLGFAHAQFSLCDQRHAQWRHQHLQFGQFPGVVRGENKFHVKTG